ncbi:MAG: DUF4198 domain-containing protein [bacterium]|nr:DUF4198 domain-containing protein [bacterium]
MTTSSKLSPQSALSVDWRSSVIAVFASLLILGVVGGCGNQGRGVVSGTVTLDGEPLPEATVEFQPDVGSPSFGRTDANGKYVLKYTANKHGAEIGSHTVNISTFYIKSEGEKRIPMPEKVPAKYSNNEKLIREVTAGSQVIDFDLTTDG